MLPGMPETRRKLRETSAKLPCQVARDPCEIAKMPETHAKHSPPDFETCLNLFGNITRLHTSINLFNSALVHMLHNNLIRI